MEFTATTVTPGKSSSACLILGIYEGNKLSPSAAQADGIRESPLMAQMLGDRALMHRAKAALVEITGGGELMSLDVESGVVTLSGLVESDAVKSGCEKALLKIPGITSVHNRVAVQSKDGRIL